VLSPLQGGPEDDSPPMESDEPLAGDETEVTERGLGNGEVETK
jgi:hypothetical protein